MIELPVPLVLASGSPRRRELLTSVGLAFEVRPADIDESVRGDESPVDYVARLARTKAGAVAVGATIVLAADTTVAVDGHILEKPLDDDDARRMLALLSGRSHLVHTGVCVRRDGREQLEVVTTEVWFAELRPATIEWYLATGQAHDKAGAYGIQGAAGAFVERVHGSVSNVIGLPLAETMAMLASAVDD